IGSRVPESLTQLACEDIVIVGYVPDLSEYLKGLRVAVNPLRYGAGIKGKIVTSMAYGLPCVGTSLAFEGMGLTDEEDVLIGDTPEQFAQAVVRLYCDENLWRNLSQRGVKIVKERYSFHIAKQSFETLFSELSDHQYPCTSPR
ncbi:MAG: glycosyltransferase family 4 protein, partial [Nitrospirales bacterium]|nr:glycosyltransferase family 4 protein [Nitrospirales bacterium]